MLIAIEGADGAGTTTQCRLLVEWLAAAGRAVHETREPSTGPIGTLIRSCLAGDSEPIDLGALALLFAADRLDHVAREIAPAIARGALVVSDRYVLSSVVYQGLTLPRAFVLDVNQLARQPDLTVLVDVSPEVAAARRAARGTAPEFFDEESTQRRVIERYRAEATHLRDAGARVAIVHGEPAPHVVAQAIREAVARHLDVH